MDRREYLGDSQEALAAALDGRQSSIWTAMPGEIQSFDAKEQTAKVQITIKGYQLTDKNEVKAVNMPLLIHCPVQFPAGGGVTLTFGVNAGDECLMVFASRCIDSWWQSGGIQAQAEFRMHDLSDGFCILGFKSKPKVISDISTTAAQLRSDDASTLIELDPTAQTVTLKAPGGITLDGPVTATSTIDATGEVTANGTRVHTHTHSGVTTGSGNTGEPN